MLVGMRGNDGNTSNAPLKIKQINDSENVEIESPDKSSISN